METSQGERQILDQLTELNATVARQNALARMFVSGIMYGIGFFLGSAIIATIALGVFGPWVGRIAWVRTAFQTGVEIRHE